MQCVVIGALMSALVLSHQRNALQSPVSTITVAKNACMKSKLAWHSYGADRSFIYICVFREKYRMSQKKV